MILKFRNENYYATGLIHNGFTTDCFSSGSPATLRLLILRDNKA